MLVNRITRRLSRREIVRCFTFTAVYPIAEPVCSETNVVVVDGIRHVYTMNPSGVVVGENAYFKIEVRPDDYPDARIVWSFDEDAGDGAAEFVGGNTGRSVCVRGLTEGRMRMKAQIGDAVSPPPSFDFQVISNSVVKLSVWIVEDAENGLVARTEADVRNLVRQANDIYRQVGVTLDLGDRIVITNIPKAYNLLWEGMSNAMWNFDQLVDTHSNTGGLEVYFINAFYDISGAERRTLGGSSDDGIVVVRKGEALTLAHEVGHSLGLSDIYVSNDESETKVLPADLLSVRSDMVRREFVPEDWSNDCGSGYNGKGIGGSRYYRAGLKMSELIPRLLMYGIDSPRSRDIPIGPVYGVWYKWIDGNKSWSKDFVPIGIGTPSLFDVHRTHQ